MFVVAENWRRTWNASILNVVVGGRSVAAFAHRVEAFSELYAALSLARARPYVDKLAETVVGTREQTDILLIVNRLLADIWERRERKSTSELVAAGRVVGRDEIGRVQNDNIIAWTFDHLTCASDHGE